MIYGMTNEELIKELNTCRMAQVVMDNTVADLEAKLAKAVEALEWQASQPEAHPFMAQHARTALAELKGETYDRPTTEK